jgi:hypothetical protein
LFHPTLENYVYSPFAQENWNELANQAHPIFAKSADELIDGVKEVKDVRFWRLRANESAP